MAKKTETPKAEAAALAIAHPGLTPFRDQQAVASYSHADAVYPVESGIVYLPAREAWVHDMQREGYIVEVK